VHLLKGSIHSQRGPVVDGERDFSICDECGKIHPHGNDEVTLQKSFDWLQQAYFAGDARRDAQESPAQKTVLLVKASPHVIPTPKNSEGRVDFGAVATGKTIWITITKEGPLRGRRVMITKRPDGLFAITGGAKAARDRGYFHAALEFGKQRELTDEEKASREKFRVKEEEKKQQRQAFFKEHGGDLNKLKTAQKDVRAKIWQSMGIDSDEEASEKLRSYRAKARDLLVKAGYEKDDAAKISDEMANSEKARLKFVRERALKEAMKRAYEAERSKAAQLANQPAAEPPKAKEDKGSAEDDAPAGDTARENAGDAAQTEETPAVEETPLLSEEQRQELHGLDADTLTPEDIPAPDAGKTLTDEQRQKISEGIKARHEEKRRLAAEEAAAEAQRAREAEDQKRMAGSDSKDMLRWIGEHRHLQETERKLRAKQEKAIGPEFSGTIAALNFRQTGTDIIGEDEAVQKAMSTIEDQIEEEKRGDFYARLAEMARNPETGDHDPHNPFGHLAAHYEAGGIKTLNRIATEFLGADILRGELVKGLGLQAATEVVVERLKREGADLEHVREWVRQQEGREMDTLERALERDETLQTEHTELQKQAGEEYGKGTRLHDAVKALYEADNLARQHENMGEALGGLEAIGSFALALDSKPGGVIELSVGEDLSGFRQRVSRTVSAGVAKRIVGKTKRDGTRVAQVRIADLRNFVDRMGAVNTTQVALAKIASGKENTADFVVPGIKIGEGHDFGTFRPGQQSDVRHVMKQLEVLEKEKNLSNAEKSLRTAGLFINREVGGGKSLISLAVAQQMLNQNKDNNRPVIFTCPEKLLANWHGQVKQWCEDPSAMVFGQHPGGKLSADDAGEDGQAAQYLQNKDGLQKMVNQILSGKAPRRLVIGQKALNAKVRVKMPGMTKSEEMTVAQALNYTNPLLVAHDEPQTMTTAKKGVLGEAGKAATRMGVGLKDENDSPLHCARLALTATPARHNVGQLYDMARWVTGGTIGTRKSFESKNGTLGKGTNVFEESQGDAVLNKLRTQMVSERGQKQHTPYVGKRLSNMDEWQKTAQATTSSEYGPHIEALTAALEKPQFRAGNFQVKMSTGWKEKEITNRRDAEAWRDRLLEKHDADQYAHLYGVPAGGNWKDNPALVEASKALRERDKANPGEQSILWAPHEDTLRGLKQMLREEYPDESFTTMWKESEMPGNSEEFKSGKHRFVVASHKANSGYNLQNAGSALFVGLPKEAVENIQARGRIERDPRAGDPVTYHIDYEDAPTVHRQNHIRANEQRLIEATNLAVRGKNDLPIPAETTGVLARADAYTGEYSEQRKAA
jgi:hypothetical protein